MSEMIYGGTPAGSSTLNRWAYVKTRVKNDKRIGDVFEINPGGFLRQYMYITATCATASLEIVYMTPNETGCVGSITLFRKEDTSVAFTAYLSATQDYKTLRLDVPCGGTLSEFEVIIQNNGKEKLQIAKISLSGANKSTVTKQVDAKTFAKYAIIYGLDADKPNLRGE